MLRVLMVMPLFLFGSVTAWAQLPSPVQGTTTIPSSAPEQAEVIPARPTRWFNDYALVTSPTFGANMEERLVRFEKETTNQFIVVIIPKMQSSADLGGYCTRVFRAWSVGQEGINNGVILFVFLQDHKLQLTVGRGLETPLTTPVCQGIVEQMVHAFRLGDFEGGITTGVDAVMTRLRAHEQSPHSTP